MMRKPTGIEIIEERHAAKVLLYLYTKGPTIKGDLYDGLDKGIRVVLDRVNLFTDIGLVEETILPVKPFTKTLILTPKGRRVAELLAKVEEELRHP